MRTTTLVLALVAISLRPAHAQANPYQAAITAAGALYAASSTPTPLWTGTQDASLFAARRFNSRAPGATLMIIGGAGIVAGILVGGSGGTALILAGVGIGAYGVYLYTR